LHRGGLATEGNLSLAKWKKMKREKDLQKAAVWLLLSITKPGTDFLPHYSNLFSYSI